MMYLSTANQNVNKGPITEKWAHLEGKLITSHVKGDVSSKY